MKILHIFLFLFIGNLCYCQQKTFTPKSGEIVFEKKETINNLQEFSTSVQKLDSGVKKQVLDERSQIGEKTDTVILNSMMQEVSKAMTNPKKNTYQLHHVFRKNLIVSYTTLDNKVHGDYTLINTRTSLTSMLAKKDSTTIFMANRRFPYAVAHVIITVNRKETRQINGFSCFKVIALVKDTDNEDYPGLPKETKTIEMWVTDKIKCLYHPAIWNKEILEKYYPLEIIETSDMMKGYKTVYTLSSFSLK